MNKLYRLIFLIITLFFLSYLSSSKISAIENPFSVANNIYGIHILDENDLEDAAKLVNSNQGDWGYVTLVIRKDERDVKRWQKVFDKMRRLHLIPIIRIATIQIDDHWEKPNIDEVDGWVSFLNSLNWVIKNRYVIIGNEPNHAKEWGGEISPEEYADYLKIFSLKLKSVSNDFFVLPAGFDASAANSKETMKEEDFLRRMHEYEPEIFNRIDGFASHSYPNPNFSGSETATGKGSVKTYEWELSLLKDMGVNKNLPIFITETGWAHDKEGKKNGFFEVEIISDKLVNSYNSAWKDPRIASITPFVLNYQNPPFDIFSWKKPDGSFYKFYYDVQNLAKIKGRPFQKVSVDVLSVIFPPIFPDGGKMKGGISIIKNTGQTIWSGKEVIRSRYLNLDIEIQPKIIFSDIEPGEKALAVFSTEVAK